MHLVNHLDMADYAPMTPMTPMKTIRRGLTRSDMEFSSPKCAPALAATKLLGAHPSSVATGHRQQHG